MDEEVCNPMIVHVNHNCRELEGITVGLGGKKY
jgi:hypothetical protein